MQTKLFQTSQPQQAQEPRPEPKPNFSEEEWTKGQTEFRHDPAPEYPDETLLDHIANESYLWDMRCWDTRSREEARQWLLEIRDSENHDHKNCGHVVFCVEALLYRHPDWVEKILDVMMANKRIQYAKRIVRCFYTVDNPNEHPCPKFRRAGNYSDCHCEECET